MTSRLSKSFSRSVTKDELSQIKPPEATETWKPVSHYELVSAVETGISRHKMSIRKSEFAVQRGDNFFFAVYDLKRQDDPTDYCPSIGLRSSTNRKISIQMAIGARVFVCDNLAFSGDMIALRKKHTHGLDLLEEVDHALFRFFRMFESFEKEVENMKHVILPPEKAKIFIFDVFKADVFPIRLLKPVSKEFFSKETQTAWDLHNAFTNAAKKLDGNKRFEGLRNIGNEFRGLMKEIPTNQIIHV